MHPCAAALAVQQLAQQVLRGGAAGLGSSHAGKTSVARLADTYANARLIHLPIHASWLNQIEIYFSILQRKALTPNDFEHLEALRARIAAFEAHYRRQIAKPFDWTFTRADLNAPRPPGQP